MVIAYIQTGRICMKTRFRICALALVVVSGCGGGSSGGSTTTMSTYVAPGSMTSCTEGAGKGADAVLKTLVGAGIFAGLQGCIQLPSSPVFGPGALIAIYTIPDADVKAAENMCMQRIDVSQYTDTSFPRSFQVTPCPP